MNQSRAEVKNGMELYEKMWTIPDWVRVQQNEHLLTAQTFQFETGKSNRVQAKWETGFNLDRSRSTPLIQVYWKLVEVSGGQDQKLQTFISSSIMRGDSGVTTEEYMNEEVTFEVNQIYKFPPQLVFQFDPPFWNSFVNSNGELTIKLNLTLLKPEAYAAQLKLDEFRKSSLVKACADYAMILNDNSTADLKILTSDGKELLAHKAILKARCPVFDSMFRSRMSESQTGIVDVQDIAGKTMGIFLHYFYSGELLPSWKDEDTVVEFTYAAGKYQLTDILELLDAVLGTRDDEDASQTDIQLIELVAKLGLKNAEKELLLRIAEKTNKVKSQEELFGLYGLGRE